MLSKDLNAKNIINGYKTIKVLVDLSGTYKKNEVIKFYFGKTELNINNRYIDADKRFNKLFCGKIIRYID